MLARASSLTKGLPVHPQRELSFKIDECYQCDAPLVEGPKTEYEVLVLPGRVGYETARRPHRCEVKSGCSSPVDAKTGPGHAPPGEEGRERA